MTGGRGPCTPGASSLLRSQQRLPLAHQTIPRGFSEPPARAPTFPSSLFCCSSSSRCSCSHSQTRRGLPCPCLCPAVFLPSMLLPRGLQLAKNLARSSRLLSSAPSSRKPSLIAAALLCSCSSGVFPGTLRACACVVGGVGRPRVSSSLLGQGPRSSRSSRAGTLLSPPSTFVPPVGLSTRLKTLSDACERRLKGTGVQRRRAPGVRRRRKCLGLGVWEGLPRGADLEGREVSERVAWADAGFRRKASRAGKAPWCAQAD